jgi:hypothetical protein
VKCEILGLKKNFQRTCFEYFFSKACQYATNDEKVCMDLKYVFFKNSRKFIEMHHLENEM